MQTFVWVRCWPPNRCLLAGCAHLGAPQRLLAAPLAGGLAMAALQVPGCSSPSSSRARWASPRAKTQRGIGTCVVVLEAGLGLLSLLFCMLIEGKNHPDLSDRLPMLVFPVVGERVRGLVMSCETLAA